MKKFYVSLVMLPLAFGASSAFAAPACELVAPAIVEAVIGQKIAKKTESKGALSEACSYLTTPGAR